jgi:hypothetical protein
VGTFACSFDRELDKVPDLYLVSLPIAVRTIRLQRMSKCRPAEAGRMSDKIKEHKKLWPGLQPGRPFFNTGVLASWIELSLSYLENASGSRS